MIRLILEAVKEWVESLFEARGRKFDVMPSVEQLFELPVDKPFYCYGFYNRNDGNGGTYYITANWVKGGRKITYGNSTRFLVALNQYGSVNNVVELARYGIRPVNSVDYDNINPTDSYATENSEIFKNIYLPNKHATLKLPRGRFVFAETLDLYQAGRNYSLVGESGISFDIRTPELYTSSDATTGTMLYFPWLLDGQYAINGRFCSIENIVVIGNPKTYNINFDRTKFATDPSSVVTETIDNDVKCVGIYASQCKLMNVEVVNFYTGVSIRTSNCYLNTVFAISCHLGFEINNDIKILGMYGSRVHTLASFFGAISSVTQARVDSCVNMFNIKHGSGFNFIDIDGDWCTDSLFLIGQEGKSSTVRGNSFIGVHGRCNTLTAYPVSDEMKDIRTLVDTEGYGIFRIVGQCTFKDNYITLGSLLSHTPEDTSSTPQYRLPEIVLTFDNSNNVITNNTFKVNALLTEEEVLKLFQVKENTRIGVIDSYSNSYKVEGSNITSDSTDPTDIDFSDIEV